MAITIGRENLDLLRDPAFDIPKARQPGDFGVYLGDGLRRYFEQTARLRGPLADARQAAGGRYMIKWEGGLQPYQSTPFGRMEYWLDRPDLAVARIDAV